MSKQPTKVWLVIILLIYIFCVAVTIMAPLVEVTVFANNSFCLSEPMVEFAISYVVLDTVIPLLVAVVSYFFIIRALRQTKLTVGRDSTKRAAAKNLLINALLTSILFLLLNAFDRVMYVAESLGLTSSYNFGSPLQVLGLGLVLSNNVLTPFVFYACLPQVRHAALVTLTCGLRARSARKTTRIHSNGPASNNELPSVMTETYSA